MDHSYFLHRKPSQKIDVRAGLIDIGKAPLGQGHQAPLSYWIASKYLSAVLPEKVSPFLDVEAGLAFSTKSLILSGHGKEYCYAQEADKLSNSSSVRKTRHAFKMLRSLNALYYGLCFFIVWGLARITFPDSVRSQIVTLLIFGSFPTAIWRSVYINNGNLTSLLGAIGLSAAIYISIKDSSYPFRWAIAIGISSGLAMLGKYTAIVIAPGVLISILLAQHYSVTKRILILAISGCIAAIIVAPDLYQNYQIDGGLFSTKVIAEVVPFLHYPRTFINLILDPEFIGKLFLSFWINYLNLGTLDWQVPFWSIGVGLVFLIVPMVGLFLFSKHQNSHKLSGVENPTVLRKILFLSITSICGGLILFILGTRPFPIPNGRYLHPLLPFAAIALSVGLLNLPKYALTFTTSSFIFAHALTAHFFWLRYPSCRTDSELIMAPGVAMSAADINNDGEDELMLYQRAKNRAYFLNLSPKPKIIREWTRAIGLPADNYALADVDAHKGADVVTRRAFGSEIFYYPGTTILKYNNKFHYLRDRATPPISVGDFTFKGDLFGSFDADGDGKSGIYLYNSKEGLLHLRLGVIALPNRILSFEVPKDIKDLTLVNKNGKLHLFSIDGKSLREHKLLTKEPAQIISKLPLKHQALRIFYSHALLSHILVADGKCLLINKKTEKLQPGEWQSCPSIAEDISRFAQFSIVEQTGETLLAYFNSKTGNIELQALQPQVNTGSVNIQLDW